MLAATVEVESHQCHIAKLHTHRLHARDGNGKNATWEELPPTAV